MRNRLIMFGISYDQGKGVWMAKHIRIYEGSRRDACGAIKRKTIRCYYASDHRYKHFKRTFPWLG